MKKMYHYIIEKRFIISIVLIVVLSMIGFFVNLKNMSGIEWITNTNKMLSPWMNIKFCGLFLSCYELFLIITNENKQLSFYGSIVLLFSSAIAYNFTKIDSLIFGSLSIVLLNKLLNENSQRKSVIYGILIVLMSIFYSYTFIPYAVSFGYLFIALWIYVILKSKKMLSGDKNKIVLLIGTVVLSVLGMTISKLFWKNEYVEDSSMSANGLSLMFSYLYNILLPFNNIENKALLGSIFSICPLPILISLYYIYKNEKHVEFLLPITAIAVFEIVFCLIEIPNGLKKILLLENIEIARMMLSIQFANLLIIFYFLANVKEKLFSIKIAMRVTIIFIIMIALVNFPTEFSNRAYLTLFALEQTMLTFLFLNLEETSYRKVFMFFLVLLTLISGVPVYLMG